MDAPAASSERIDRTDLERALRESGAVTGAARLLAVVTRPIGIGHTADTLKAELTWARPGDGPATLVAKIPSADPQSAATAASLGLYEREVRFYHELAPRTALSLPRFYGALPCGGARSGVLLEDLSGLTPGDQFSDTPVATVRRLRQELAALQAPFWGDPATAAIGWLHRRLGVPIPGIHERMRRSWGATRDYLADGFAPDERAMIDRFVAGADRWAQALSGPFSLTHHDFRVGNMLFGPGRAVILDWQTAGWGAPMFDVAYLLGTSVGAPARRLIERAEVAAHVSDLADRGITWPLPEAWRAYRQASLAVLLMLVPAAGSVKRTERGDAMYRRLLAQGARMALDLDADEFLAAGQP